MFSKLFNWKKQEEKMDALPLPLSANWGFLGTDLHSHFIPGIDDGAKTMDDSIAMLRAMKEMGYKQVITTPHVMVDYYPNTAQAIQTGLLAVREALKANNIDLPVKAAAEYYMDENFMHLLETEPLLTIHENQVLVEFSMMYEPPMLMDVIFKMQTAGYKPIIAHPERYLFFHKDLSKFRMLKDRGCLMQLNMLSIAGYYGKGVKMVADDLLKKGIYDYCASDMHHEKHAAALKAMAMSKDYHTFIGYPFLNNILYTPSA